MFIALSRTALAAVAAAILSLGLLPGTATAEGAVIPLPSADREGLEKLLGKCVIGDAQPAPPLGSPESYLPPKGSSMSYQVIEKNKKRAEAHKLEDTTDTTFAPGWHYSVEKAGAAFFQKTSDGSLHTVAEQDLGKVLSRFAPAEPMIIPGLKPGESRKSTLQVSVYDLSDLKKVTHSGSLDVTYTYIGAYRVTVPAGTYDAVLIRWNYEGEIRPADIKDSQYCFLAHGRHGADPQHLGHADLRRPYEARKGAPAGSMMHIASASTVAVGARCAKSLFRGR